MQKARECREMKRLEREAGRVAHLWRAEKTFGNITPRMNCKNSVNNIVQVLQVSTYESTMPKLCKMLAELDLVE